MKSGFAFATGITLFAAIFSCHAAMVTFEAESGVLGTDFTNGTDGTIQFISISTDLVNTGNPGNANRVASYSVTFPEAGTYQLYARVRVGPNNFNDDSLFYASSFGNKSPTLNSDWILVNGLASAGFSNSTDVVTGGGSLGSGMWKWVNLSQFTSQSGFAVSAGNLTQTFQIGARENGLDMDKFVFGTAGTAFTVSNLDTGTLPPQAPAPNTNLFIGPDGVALHRFSGLNSGLNLDGANPAAGLIFSSGVLLGTTMNGGTQGAGTMFTLSLDGTNFSVLRSFTNAPDVANPQTDLVNAGGIFFGGTIAGGSNSVGTVFLADANGILSILKNFSTVSADNATNSGGASSSALLASSGATLFGTATAGGANANGTIFSLSTNGSAFTVLHDFSSLDSNTGTNADGALPSGGLILAGNTLFGTASAGGAGGAGVVFSLDFIHGDFSVLHDFTPLDPVTSTNDDGAYPFAGLTLSNGMLYGTTVAGGTGGKGVVYSLRDDGTGFAVLHNFSAIDSVTGVNADGAAPCASVALSGNCLYGTTSAGGANANGTVFSLPVGGGQFQVLHAFTAMDPVTATNRDGAFPVAGLLALGNLLYGTAFGGGPGAAGTVFGVAMPAMVTNIVPGADGSITLYFLGGPNSTNVVQSTVSLAAPTWVNIFTNIADASGAWQFTEPISTNAAKFYRSYAP